MNDLRKVYIIKKDYGNVTSSLASPMIESFLDTIFIPIGERYEGGRLDNSMPVFKFGAKELTFDLCSRGIVSERNLYSPLTKVSQASSKKALYELLGGQYMPKSVFTRREALSMSFPLIVKPINGWAGRGVRVISEPSHLPYDSGLVYQQHLDIDREYRFTFCKQKLLFVAKRRPSNGKCLALRDGVEEIDRNPYEPNKFVWCKRSIPKLERYRWFQRAMTIAKDVMRQTGLGIAGLDIAVDTSGKVWLIECNTSMGITHDQSVLIYQAIFEDWYGRPVDQETKRILDLFGEVLVKARKRYVRIRV